MSSFAVGCCGRCCDCFVGVVTAALGVELSVRHCHRDQPVRGSHYVAGHSPRMGVRSKPGRITDWCPRNDTAALASVSSIHRIRCTSLSHASSSYEPTAARASEPPSLEPDSRHLAVGVTCAHRLGRCRCHRDASACLIYSARTGAADAPTSNAAAFEPDAVLVRLVGLA